MPTLKSLTAVAAIAAFGISESPFTAFAFTPRAVQGAFHHVIRVPAGGTVPIPRPKPVIETQSVFEQPFERPFFKALAAYDAAIEGVSVPALDAEDGWYAAKMVFRPVQVPVAGADAWPCRMKEYLPDYSEIFEASCPNATMVASAGIRKGWSVGPDADPEQPTLRLGFDIHRDAVGRP